MVPEALKARPITVATHMKAPGKLCSTLHDAGCYSQRGEFPVIISILLLALAIHCSPVKSQEVPFLPGEPEIDGHIGDRNCPYELTVELAEKLKKAGAEVTFIAEDTGHEAPGKGATGQFFKWLRSAIPNEASGNPDP